MDGPPERFAGFLGAGKFIAKTQEKACIAEYFCYNTFCFDNRAVNSAGECYLHTVEVRGSNPLQPNHTQIGIGDVAQLGERCFRTAEVGGSNPLISTNSSIYRPKKIMINPLPHRLAKNQLQYFSQLLRKKYRRQRRQFLVEGVRLCRELLASSYQIVAVFFSERLSRHPTGSQLLAMIDQRGVVCYQIDDAMLQRLSATKNPQPIVACAAMADHDLNYDFFNGSRRFLVLLNLSDPGNVGTLLRTAEAFNWDRVICLGDTADIYNPKVVRATMGSLFRLKIAWSNLETALSFFEYTDVSSFISMPTQGIALPLAKIPPKIALFLGNEAHGLPKQLGEQADTIVYLPMAAPVESLNVAVAGGILLYLLQVSD